MYLRVVPSFGVGGWEGRDLGVLSLEVFFPDLGGAYTI